MLVIDYFDRGCAIDPSAVFLRTVVDGREVTYAEASAKVDAIAASLQTAGVLEGSGVAVLSPNDPDAFLCVLGALRAGAAWTPLNAGSSASELASLLATTRCQVLFYSEALAELAEQVIAASPSLTTTVAIGQGRPGDPSLEEWVSYDLAVRPVSRDPEGIALLPGTGGTTGEPKAVKITHRMIETMTLGMLAHMPEPTPPIVAVAAPMTHAAGVTAWAAISRGATLVIHPGFDAERLLRSIERDGITNLFLPPTAIYALLAHPKVREFDYSSLRYLIYAAAPMSVEKLREAVDVFGPVMCQTFGQAEAPMMVTCLEPRDHVEALADPDLESRLSSVGRPSYVAKVEIMDDDGRLLDDGELGEIVVSSTLVGPGYFENEEQTAATKRPGGWHGTSDVGYRDSEGYIHLVDRKRDLIISGGFNIWPSEVEQVIHQIDGVLDCSVIGLPDSYWGECVTAVVELRAGAEVSDDEVVAACRDRLGPIKAPKRVIFRGLPRSAVGKVLKRELRDEYWQGRERSL